MAGKKETPRPARINAELIYYRLDEISTQLNDFKDNYVTKEESQALKEQIEGLRVEIAEIKKSKNLWNWLSPTLTAIIVAVVTYLTIEYFKSR